MAIGENRIKVTGSDGKTYWWNPNTQKLFYTKKGTEVVVGFTGEWEQGNVAVIEVASAGPGGKGTGENRVPIIGWDGNLYYVNYNTGNVFDAEGNFIQTGHWSVVNGVFYFTDDNNQAVGYTPPPAEPDTDNDGTPDHSDPDQVPPPTPPVDPATEAAQAALMDSLSVWLKQYGLESLTGFVLGAISDGWSYDRILLEIRNTPEYKARFPGLSERLAKGFNAMSEAAYLQYEDTVRSLFTQYGYKLPTAEEIAAGIATNQSPAEVQHRLEVQAQIDLYGDEVENVFENLLGINMDDDELREFFDPEAVSRPEWDLAYTRARMMGQPAILGLGVRSQTEADALIAMGVDPDEAFARYQQVSQEAPRFERLAQIEQNLLGRLPEEFGSFLAKTDNKTLVDALVLLDPRALATIQNLAMREIGRWNAGGGAAVDQSGASAGLISREERSR